jgi:hypothetical protein
MKVQGQVNWPAGVHLPVGNKTGVTFYSGELNAKQIELLSQIALKCSDVGYLVNPKAASSQQASRVGLKFRRSAIR